MSVTVTKLGAEPPATSDGKGDTWTKVEGVPNPFVPTGGPLVGGRRRRQRNVKTFPKGILRKTSKARIHPTRNPSKSDTRKSSVRMMTEKGLTKTRKRIHEKAAKMKISNITEILLKKKIISEKNAKKIPHGDLRMLYRDSVGAGLL
jgi:hypothetical protein